MFRAETLHFRSCVDQVGFYRARDAKDSDAMRAFAEKELRTAKEMLPLVRAASSFGYESSNQYFFVPRDVLEKVLSCAAVLVEGSNGKRPHDIRFEDVLIERTDYVPGEMVRVVNADNVSLDGIRYLDAR